MSNLDTPAIGRKIAYLMHHDRAGLIAILAGTLPSCWPDLASAYLQALGCTEACDRQATVPGVLFLWQQLLKEHHNAAAQSKPRSDLPEPDRTGERSRQITQSE